jgi:hypothetical protein
MHVGISGSNIKHENNFFIKSSNNIERFKKQLEKQVNFQNFSCFKTPKIFSVKQQDDALVCYMEYIYGLDSINYFSIADKRDLDNLFNNFILFIENNIKKSEIKIIYKSIFYNKLESLNINYKLKNNIFCYLNKIEEEIFLPIGYYHGDLTFANMIFQNNEIFLVDFLDCFIETPLQDIVKLRQETNFFWSVLQHKELLKKNINYNKVCLSFSYLDSKFNDYFKKFEWYIKNYNLLQIFNLARIIPYNQEKNIEYALINKIEKIIEDEKFNNTGSRPF